MRAMDLSGMVFGRLTVIRRNGSDKKGQSMFLCQCSCGEQTTAQGYSIKTGDTKSCGCLKKEVVAAGANTRHGMYGTPTYKSWASMMDRCGNPKHLHYDNYGGRGIKVCLQWQTFAGFYKDMGVRPEGTSLDRTRSNEDYSPVNCKWSTRLEQGRNVRSNVLLTFQGKTLCVTEWAGITGIGRSTIEYRLKNGWSVDKALSKAVQGQSVLTP